MDLYLIVQNDHGVKTCSASGVTCLLLYGKIYFPKTVGQRSEIFTWWPCEETTAENVQKLALGSKGTQPRIRSFIKTNYEIK